MEKFDSIRPYNDKEFAAAIKRITNHEYLPIIINTVFLNTDAQQYIKGMKSYKTVRDFQHGFMRDVVENILKKNHVSIPATFILTQNKDLDVWQGTLEKQQVSTIRK